MKKLFSLAICAFAATAVFSLSGCIHFSGDTYRYNFRYALPAEDEDNYYYLLRENRYFAAYLQQSKQTEEFSIVKIETGDGVSAGATPYEEYDGSQVKNTQKFEGVNGEYFEIPASPVVLEGSTFHLASTALSPDYEELYYYLVSTYVESGDANALCYLAISDSNGVAYGFCNAYGWSGYLWGDGDCGVEYATFSVYFTYDARTDEFTEVALYDGCYIVAFSENSVIYLRDGKYYSNCGGKESYICGDAVLGNDSSACFRFNNDYAVLYFANYDVSDGNTCDYVAVCDFGGNILFELKDEESLSGMASDKINE